MSTLRSRLNDLSNFFSTARTTPVNGNRSQPPRARAIAIPRFKLDRANLKDLEGLLTYVEAVTSLDLIYEKTNPGPQDNEPTPTEKKRIINDFLLVKLRLIENEISDYLNLKITISQLSEHETESMQKAVLTLKVLTKINHDQAIIDEDRQLSRKLFTPEVLVSIENDLLYQDIQARYIDFKKTISKTSLVRLTNQKKDLQEFISNKILFKLAIDLKTKQDFDYPEAFKLLRNLNHENPNINENLLKIFISHIQIQNNFGNLSVDNKIDFLFTCFKLKDKLPGLITDEDLKIKINELLNTDDLTTLEKLNTYKIFLKNNISRTALVYQPLLDLSGSTKKDMEAKIQLIWSDIEDSTIEDSTIEHSTIEHSTTDLKPSSKTDQELMMEYFKYKISSATANRNEEDKKKYLFLQWYFKCFCTNLKTREKTPIISMLKAHHESEGLTLVQLSEQVTLEYQANPHKIVVGEFCKRGLMSENIFQLDPEWHKKISDNTLIQKFFEHHGPNFTDNIDAIVKRPSDSLNIEQIGKNFGKSLYRAGDKEDILRKINLHAFTLSKPEFAKLEIAALEEYLSRRGEAALRQRGEAAIPKCIEQQLYIIATKTPNIRTVTRNDSIIRYVVSKRDEIDRAKQALRQMGYHDQQISLNDIDTICRALKTQQDIGWLGSKYKTRFLTGGRHIKINDRAVKISGGVYAAIQDAKKQNSNDSCSCLPRRRPRPEQPIMSFSEIMQKHARERLQQSTRRSWWCGRSSNTTEFYQSLAGPGVN